MSDNDVLDTTVENEDLLNLDSFNDDYAVAKVGEKKKFAEVPDGDYNVVVDKVSLKMSKSLKPQISMGLKILDGEFANKYIWKNSTITNASLPIVKSELELCGVVLSKFGDLKERYTELLDVKLEITKRKQKDNDQFFNVYLNKRLEDDEVEETVKDFDPLALNRS